jgi:hypothetical protein
MCIEQGVLKVSIPKSAQAGPHEVSIPKSAQAGPHKVSIPKPAQAGPHEIAIKASAGESARGETRGRAVLQAVGSSAVSVSSAPVAGWWLRRWRRCM